MYPWLEYWYEEFNTCSCNKCNGQIIAIMSKDKYNQVDIEKLFCSECGREFLQFSYNSDYLNCYDVNPTKIKDLDRIKFTWDKWIDPNER